jgi:hypothetical protein
MTYLTILSQSEMAVESFGESGAKTFVFLIVIIACKLVF